jgi:hypothetical protein
MKRSRGAPVIPGRPTVEHVRIGYAQSNESVSPQAPAQLIMSV